MGIKSSLFYFPSFLKYSSIFPLLSLLAIQSSHAFEQKLDAIQDTYVHSGSASTSFNSENELILKTTGSGVNNREAYIEFNISSLPNTNDSVYFRVGILSASNDVDIYTYHGNWNASSTTWNNRLPNSDLHAIVPELEGTYLIADLTRAVNDARNDGETSLTVILRSGSETSSSMSLASNEHSSSFLRPRLYLDDPDTADPFAFEVTYSNTERGTFPGRSLISGGTKAQLSSYGGWLDWNLGGTGFFRTQQVDGSWFLVDPEGYVFYSMGLNSVEQGGGIQLPGALLDMGLNTTGRWSDQNISGIPRTPHLSFLGPFSRTNNEFRELFDADILPVFFEEFEEYTNEQAEALAGDRNDPWILGIFSDNELNFHKEQLEANLNQPSNSPQYQAAHNWMVSKYGNGYSTNNITTADEEAFSGVVADRYFSIVSAAIKHNDPNHLYIGARLHAAAKSNPHIVEAAGKYSDIISINNYGDWAPENGDGMDLWLDVGGKPFIITEFYTKAENSGLLNDDGAGWLVDTQEDRVNFFENFVMTLMAHPGSVGWHWFRYIDNNDSNKGILNTNFSWYQQLQSSFTNIAEQAYPLRGHLMWNSVDYDGRANDSNSNSSTPVHITKRNMTSFAIDGNNGGDNGQSIYLWSENENNLNQQWLEINRGNGYYSYQKMNTNYCIDGGNGGENNQDVYLWTCSDNNQNQHWQKVNAGGGSFKLTKRNASGFALNGGSGGANGQNVNLYNSSANSQNLHWVISPL